MLLIHHTNVTEFQDSKLEKYICWAQRAIKGFWYIVTLDGRIVTTSQNQKIGLKS